MNFLWPVLVLVFLLVGHAYLPLIFLGGCLPWVAAIVISIIVAAKNIHDDKVEAVSFIFLISFMAISTILAVKASSTSDKANTIVNSTQQVSSKVQKAPPIRFTNYVITRKFMIMDKGCSCRKRYYIVVADINKSEIIFRLDHWRDGKVWANSPVGNILSADYVTETEFIGPVSAIKGLIRDNDEAIYW